jgi:hypothetical protein
VSVERHDIGELKRPQRTPQGFLRAEMYATRTGVFEYPKADGGCVREYRAPEVLAILSHVATVKPRFSVRADAVKVAS